MPGSSPEEVTHRTLEEYAGYFPDSITSHELQDLADAIVENLRKAGAIIDVPF